jgi:hypothetical protein
MFGCIDFLEIDIPPLNIFGNCRGRKIGQQTSLKHCPMGNALQNRAGLFIIVYCLWHSSTSIALLYPGLAVGSNCQSIRLDPWRDYNPILKFPAHLFLISKLGSYLPISDSLSTIAHNGLRIRTGAFRCVIDDRVIGYHFLAMGTNDLVFHSRTSLGNCENFL